MHPWLKLKVWFGFPTSQWSGRFFCRVDGGHAKKLSSLEICRFHSGKLHKWRRSIVSSGHLGHSFCFRRIDDERIWILSLKIKFDVTSPVKYFYIPPSNDLQKDIFESIVWHRTFQNGKPICAMWRKILLYKKYLKVILTENLIEKSMSEEVRIIFLLFLIMKMFG